MKISNAKLTEVLVSDLAELPSVESRIRGELYFCCLGTTIKTAGSKENFEEIDHDAIVAFAKIAKAHEAKTFTLVSAMGANANSMVFYNRVKGELEEALRGLGYPRLTIVRPSLLLGPRAELRLGEEVAKRITRWLGPLVPRPYKPVEARAVATALVNAARQKSSGVKVIESGEIAEQRAT